MGYPGDMANGINFVMNPPSYSGRGGVDTTRQAPRPQPAIKSTVNPASNARTPFAYDDIPNPAAGAGSVGNGYKPFRVSGG